MKGLLYFILGIVVIVIIVSAFMWGVGDMTFDEQIEYVKATVNESVSDNAASNTAESAAKLGKVLKGNFDEAQDVYENGAEAKYE